MTEKFSVVIPARDEEGHLPSCIQALHESARYAGAEIEVVVVLNRCTDRTEEIAHELGARTVSCDAKNLSAIRNVGVAATSHPWIATIDADSTVCREMFARLAEQLSQEDVIGGGVMMYPSRYSTGIVLTGLLLLPIALWHGISGGLFFFRKDEFEAIGGFDEAFVSVEDIDFAKRLRDFGKGRGKRFVTLWRTWIITSTRKFDRFGDWYFLLRPSLLFHLFRGKNQQYADQVWYDFKR
ncbi:glycosyltransferase [bacterium]|nr:glycosyltransferase [bacterium]